MAAHSVLRDGMQGARGSEWLIPFVSSPDTGRRSRAVREGLPAAAPATGCYGVTCRSRSATQQTARKTSAHRGCDKIARSRRCAPRHRSPGCRHDTVRVASVREWRQAAAPASGCYAVTCRSRYLRRTPCDHRDFVSNAAHGGLNQRFLSPNCRQPWCPSLFSVSTLLSAICSASGKAATARSTLVSRSKCSVG